MLAKNWVDASIDLCKSSMVCVEPTTSGTKKFGLEVRANADASAEIGHTKGGLVIFAKSLSKTRTKACSETSGPLIECRSWVGADRILIEGFDFVDPPTLSGTSKAKMQIIPNLDRVSTGDSVFDTFAEGFNVPVVGIFADCAHVACRGTFINWQIGLEIAEVLHAPTVIDLILRLWRRGRGIWWSVPTNSVEELLVGHDLSNDTLELVIGQRVSHGDGLGVVSDS